MKSADEPNPEKTTNKNSPTSATAVPTQMPAHVRELCAAIQADAFDLNVGFFFPRAISVLSHGETVHGLVDVGPTDRPEMHDVVQEVLLVFPIREVG